MVLEEFLRAVSNADFIKLIDTDKLTDFEKYASEMENSGEKKVVLRILFEKPNDIPTPYYIFIEYHLDDEDAVMYAPDFDDLSTYLRTPPELEGYSFYAIDSLRVNGEGAFRDDSASGSDTTFDSV